MSVKRKRRQHQPGNKEEGMEEITLQNNPKRSWYSNNANLFNEECCDCCDRCDVARIREMEVTNIK